MPLKTTYSPPPAAWDMKPTYRNLLSMETVRVCKPVFPRASDFALPPPRSS